MPVEELNAPKKYKGCIRYFKIQENKGACYIQKSRPFGAQKYRIKEDDYTWCDSYKEASALWAYCHRVGTACHYSDENVHPRTGRKYSDYKNEIDAHCKQGIHKDWWFYNTYKVCQNCKTEELTTNKLPCR